MEPAPSPEPSHDRIGQAAERVNAAMARLSRAQELLTIAKERLARARLALAEPKIPRAHDAPAHGACRRGTINASPSSECFADEAQPPQGLPPLPDPDR